MPNIRLVFDDWANSTTPSPLYATALHRDALGNVRAVTGFSTDATKQGKMTERSVFRPYGQAVPFDKDITTPNESKGFIGERYDGDAGLQYLNARYYDPKLAMFIQPDWWEVTKAGVGTNRYSYSFDDPVNKSDGTGHSWLDRTFDSLFGSGSFNKTFGDKGSATSDKVFGNGHEKKYADNYFKNSTVYQKEKIGYGASKVFVDDVGADPNADMYVYGEVAGAFVGGKIASQVVKTAATYIFAGNIASYEVAGFYGTASYRTLANVTKGLSVEVHHLIEKRFANVFGQKASEMVSVVLTKAEHQVLTNAWRSEIPYGAQGTGVATKQMVEDAARRIYADFPDILGQLGLK